MNFDYTDLFNTIKPGFLESEGIRSIPPEEVYEEQIMDLRTFSPDALNISCPEHIVFGMYEGDLPTLLQSVGRVEEGWLGCYHPGDRIYCAMDGDKIASFCLFDDFGEYKGLRIGGPGCVGTVPEYRRQGIGLKMVQNVTAILKQQGYDLGYIHYTGVGHWYEKLGYRTIVKWNSQGIIR